ncbi:PREDICTED: iron-sulfur assembly protein IscA, chloroplastic-like [Brassica oleracea var. oleracea]|uniref:iron-sulfur assembly protein IscA, chloroplastic-like n=1 Tax=Brassica oleracea var. oleracea TaxID=109376 RepID=UPI0006A74239|nr:PREDICTED: iron-sulfur assembly protein IscA, chloroplastic-like [Brassica oleracea var. oleracea]
MFGPPPPLLKWHLQWGLKPAISLTESTLKHLNKMRAERGEDLCLRIGVKQGGCSGMSYKMDFENRANARPDDSTIEYEGFAIVKFTWRMHSNQSCLWE